MTNITYSVRHSNGKSWAVDKYEWWQSRGRGRLGVKLNTRYFPTKEKAFVFKTKMERKERMKNERN